MTAAGRPPGVQVAPSILAADFDRLGEEVRAAETAGAARIHIDVMDGRFVPEITLGPVVVQAVRRATSLPLDIHLMIVEPDRHLEAFAQAGASSLAVQTEACPRLYQTLEQIRALGCAPWVALSPATGPGEAEWVLPLLSGVLVMTVEPGAGGRPFIPEMLAKVRALDATRRARALRFEIAVDGGIGPDTAPAAVEAGASILVAGTAIFRAPGGIGPAIARLRDAALPIRRRP